jgi:hypothetical protein
MFDYYLGKPFEWLHSRGDLETAMREHPRVLVAYHAMSWNTPDDKAMAAILSRRCTASPRGAVTLYRCER